MFLPGKWVGEGMIRLNMVEEELIFFTRWNIGVEDSGCIECKQEIEVKGLSDVMVNHFHITNIEPASFSLCMENHAIGKVGGIGVVSESRLGWEFRVKDLGFEGFESYEKQPDDSYIMQGEFSTVDQLRTSIQGKIWKPITS